MNRQRWRWPEHTLPKKPGARNVPVRGSITWIGLTVGILLLFLCYSCRTRGQEPQITIAADGNVRLGEPNPSAPLHIALGQAYYATNFIPIGEVDTNQVARRVAPPMVPPLPTPRKITRTVTTNSEMERVSVTVEKLPDPPVLKLQRKPSWTNAFFVRCGVDPGCDEEAIREPRKIQLLGSVTFPKNAVENEYSIIFWCDNCQQEFTAEYFRKISRPRAVPVTVPAK